MIAVCQNHRLFFWSAINGLRTGSTFLGLPEGKNMVALSHGTTVNKYNIRENSKIVDHKYKVGDKVVLNNHAAYKY